MHKHLNFLLCFQKSKSKSASDSTISRIWWRLYCDCISRNQFCVLWCRATIIIIDVVCWLTGGLWFEICVCWRSMSTKTMFLFLKKKKSLPLEIIIKRCREFGYQELKCYFFKGYHYCQIICQKSRGKNKKKE